jgi:peroxiredoxin
MPRVKINTQSPDFALNNFEGESIQLSQFKGKSNVLIVFNRGFT